MVMPIRADHRPETIDAVIEHWRRSFWNGQRIPLHRALRRLSPRHSDILSVLLIPVVATALLALFRNDIGLFIMGGLFFFLEPLIDGLRFASFPVTGLSTSLFVPRIDTGSPSTLQWWIGYGSCAFLLLAAAVPVQRLFPLRYFAGFFGCIQLTSQLYFSWGNGFTAVNAQEFLLDAMVLTVYWILLTPWLLCITFNLFPFSFIHKARVTALAVCYQWLFFPVQFAMQAWLLHWGSALWVPLLFFVGGLPLNVMMTLCIYAIGLSWPSVERTED